jgi:pimeloyl-ACP methyl ester carboxylesterase
MAEHIEGPLYYEVMGRSGPIMAFVHPNPMDQSCWLYQMAHMSTWYRCVAIDIPGYGRSPKATPGLTVDDIAQGCWEAVNDAFGMEPAILVGCSVGSSVIPRMFHLRPSQTSALILSGTGYSPVKDFVERRIAGYREQGVDFRWDFAFDDMSAAFGATPMAHYFADLFMERNEYADVDSIIYQFEALAAPDPDNLHSGITCPSIILSGSEDNAHPRAQALKDRIPGCELKTLPGAGHACQLEQPWLFDRFMIEFLSKNRLFPKSLLAAGAVA